MGDTIPLHRMSGSLDQKMMTGSLDRRQMMIGSLDRRQMRTGSLDRKITTTSLDRKMKVSCFVPLNNYSSTVNIPSYYTERKHEEYGTTKYILRKVACIPLAMLYGFFIVWVVSEFIMNKPNAEISFNSTSKNIIPQNVCASILNETKKYANKTPPTTNTISPKVMASSFRLSGNMPPAILRRPEINDTLVYINNTGAYEISENTLFSGYVSNSTNCTQKKQMLLFENDSLELYLITFTVMIALGVLSVFSRNTRGTMLLILPGLITRNSRKLLFTLILGMLVKGPMYTLKYNFNVALRNTACMHKSVTIATCVKQNDVNELIGYAEKLFNKVKEMEELVNQIFPATGRKDRSFRYANAKWQDLASMTAPSWSDITSQAKILVGRLNWLGNGLDIVRKCLTILSILFLIFDAINYLRSYYTDSSFDNMCIDQSIQRLWRKKGYRLLTPLRHWEINEGYNEKKLTKITKKEFFKVVRNGLATFVFILFITGVFLTDWLLSDALAYIKANQKFSIQLNGVNPNLTEYINELHSSVMKSCLSSPRQPAMQIYLFIGLLICGAIISCILEVYMSRTRAKICNLFYPDRAEERADFMHYKISTGRQVRREQFLLIIRREIERRIRLTRFSPLKRLKKLFSRLIKSIKCEKCSCIKKTIVCPGCGWKVKEFMTKEVAFSVAKKAVKASICPDCDLDIAEEETPNDNYSPYFTKQLSLVLEN